MQLTIRGNHRHLLALLAQSEIFKSRQQGLTRPRPLTHQSLELCHALAQLLIVIREKGYRLPKSVHRPGSSLTSSTAVCSSAAVSVAICLFCSPDGFAWKILTWFLGSVWGVCRTGGKSGVRGREREGES